MLESPGTHIHILWFDEHCPFFLCDRLLGEKYQIVLLSLFWVFNSYSIPDTLVTLVSLFTEYPFKEGTPEINVKLYFLTTEENLS